MSEENVDAMRRGSDAVNRRDRAGWLAVCDPELENIPPRDWPESDPTEGGDAVFDFYVEAHDDAWQGSPSYEYGEVIDVGNGKVAARTSAELQGKASGADVAWSYWQLVTFRSGKALRIEWFDTRAAALEAAKLRE